MRKTHNKVIQSNKLLHAFGITQGFPPASVAVYWGVSSAKKPKSSFKLQRKREQIKVSKSQLLLIKYTPTNLLCARMVRVANIQCLAVISFDQSL